MREEAIAAVCKNGIYLGGETSRRRFSTTKVSAPIMRPTSIQYSAGWPLNKKAAAMMANAQTSDQTMADVASFLESGIIVNTVVWLCQPSPFKSNGATTLLFLVRHAGSARPRFFRLSHLGFQRMTYNRKLTTLFPPDDCNRVTPPLSLSL